MSGYPEANLVKRKQINGTCTGCWYKYYGGICPHDEAGKNICTKEKIIYQKAKAKAVDRQVGAVK